MLKGNCQLPIVSPSTADKPPASLDSRVSLQQRSGEFFKQRVQGIRTSSPYLIKKQRRPSFPQNLIGYFKFTDAELSLFVFLVIKCKMPLGTLLSKISGFALSNGPFKNRLTLTRTITLDITGITITLGPGCSKGR